MQAKKILILTYFFPPCNLTAGQRSLGWAQYLKNFGYEPVIVTRNWEQNINGPEDMHHASGKELITEQNDSYTVHYLPFKGNIRDRLYSKYGKSKFVLLRKILSLVELIGHHFFTSLIPFHNLYRFADNYIQQNNDVAAIIVSGNPFELFRFGYLLHRNHNIPWIADYRDDWNTSNVNESRGPMDALLRRLEQRSEKKYCGTAACITTVSKHYAEKISSFTGVPGYVVQNGFFPNDYEAFQNLDPFEEFTLLYNGMLYPSQQIEVILEAFKLLVDTHPEHRNRIKIRFPGILFLKDVAARVEKLMQGYEDVLWMSPRIPRADVLTMQAKSHLLLMVSHRDAKGIPSSKIYEYLGLGKAVLICPGDGDILDETFGKYDLGFIANNTLEAFEILEKHFNAYVEQRNVVENVDRKYALRFTRENQSKALAEILDTITAMKDQTN
jgi:glycosyltransferase involved in cell wall biosynthesis